MIVMKAYKMAQMMSVPVLGIVENYSYLVCPDCGKKLSIFGESHIDEIAAEIGVPVLAKCRFIRSLPSWWTKEDLQKWITPILQRSTSNH